MNFYSETSAVNFGSVDRSDTLTIASAFELFQEAAINHADILGAGREALKQNGNAWILHRLSVFMSCRPKFSEKITTRAWPRGANKLFPIRDYDIHYSDDLCGHEDGPCLDSVLVRARSAWLIIDIENRKPLRPQIVTEKMPCNDGINALPGENADGNDPPPALRARDFSEATPILRRACYSDIDYNGHVNNARYAQWIQDLFDPEVLDNAKQIRLDINYLAEVLPGETISLYLLPIEAENIPSDSPLRRQYPWPCKAAFAIEGRRGSGAVPVFRAELKIGE